MQILKKIRPAHVFFAATLIAIALLPRLFLLGLRGFEIFSADQAIIGLMGKHILEGKPMIYFYGQGYMGSLEAFTAALLFSVGGIKLTLLQWAPLVYFLTFLPVFFLLIERAFSRATAVFTTALMAISTPYLSILSVTSLGGYPETLFFGSLFLLGCLSLRDEPRSRMALWTGLAAGLGFWTNNLILMFFLPVIALWVLRSDLWARLRAIPLRECFLLSRLRAPLWLRIAGAIFHGALLWYLVSNFAAFLFGEPHDTVSGWRTHLTSLPFHVKYLKKFVLAVSIEGLVILLLTYGPRTVLARVVDLLRVLAGFFIGSAPVWVFSLSGGEGYRVVHGSGIIFARDLPERILMLFQYGFIEGLLGVPPAALTSWQGITSLWAGLLLALWSYLIGRYVFCHREELLDLLRLKARAYSLFIVPVLLFLTVFFICMMNTLFSNRYALPAICATMFMAGSSLAMLFEKRRFTAISLALLLFVGLGVSHGHTINTIQARPDSLEHHHALIDFLKQEKVRGAYANYWQSYTLNFLGAEEVVFAAYRSPERHLAYPEKVHALREKVAYVFIDGDDDHEAFRGKLERSKMSAVKKRVGSFTIYLVEDNDPEARSRLD